MLPAGAWTKNKILRNEPILVAVAPGWTSAYRFDITDTAMLKRQFYFLARVAEQVPVKRLVMPDDFSALAEVRQAVLRDLSPCTTGRLRPLTRFFSRGNGRLRRRSGANARRSILSMTSTQQSSSRSADAQRRRPRAVADSATSNGRFSPARMRAADSSRAARSAGSPRCAF